MSRQTLAIYPGLWPPSDICNISWSAPPIYAIYPSVPLQYMQDISSPLTRNMLTRKQIVVKLDRGSPVDKRPSQGHANTTPLLMLYLTLL